MQHLANILGYALAFTYDHNHNRHTKVTGTGGGAVTDTYLYDAQDKLTGISGGANKFLMRERGLQAESFWNQLEGLGSLCR